MSCAPQDLDALDLKAEEDNLTRALAPLEAEGSACLTFVRGETLRDLQMMMTRGPWHVFHFMGHGGLKQDGSPVVAFCNRERFSELVGAAQVVRALTDNNATQLAVLNCCSSGASSEGFGSLAAGLAKRGIPAVVAMQFPITDAGAKIFSESFYEYLAKGAPVDFATVGARNEIELKRQGSLEWGIPILYFEGTGSLRLVQ